jgi:hypothetical protein
MANRCYQTVTLYGKPEKIKEVIDFVLLRKTKDFEDGTFLNDQFPVSLCSIIEPDKISLETKYGPPIKSIEELSQFFPEVGFVSGSFTDGYGAEESHHILGGSVLQGTFLEVQAPEMWEDITGTKMDLKGVA